jgi:hypothetical protein
LTRTAFPKQRPDRGCNGGRSASAAKVACSLDRGSPGGSSSCCGVTFGSGILAPRTFSIGQSVPDDACAVYWALHPLRFSLIMSRMIRTRSRYAQAERPWDPPSHASAS